MSDKKQNGYRYAPADEQEAYDEVTDEYEDEEFRDTEGEAAEEELREFAPESAELAHRYGVLANASPLWVIVAVAGFVVFLYGVIRFLTPDKGFGPAGALVAAILGAIAMVFGAGKATSVSIRKEATLKALTTSLLKESAEGILLRSRYGEKDKYPSGNTMAQIVSLGYTSEVTRKAFVEGVCPNRTNFRFMDVTASGYVVDGIIGHSVQNMMFSAIGEDDVLRGGDEYYSWIIFRTVKHIETPLLIQSWDIRNIHKAGETEECFETEDMAFNRAFCCSCESTEEAYYVLTPQLMQALHEIYTERCLEEKPAIAFAFIEDELHVVQQRERPILDLDGVKDIDGARRVCELREEFGTAVMISERLADCLTEGDYY